MVGRQVSHFRVISRVGQGGMGEVYLADDRSLGRRVALKFVTPAEAADPDASRRLRREAQAAAALDHPFICKVYEAGESEGRTYLAMEYVEGRTLKEHIAAGPLAAGEVVRLATEIAEALECAHAHGVIHRDLKPANVMVAADGHIKVMDFGIAARLTAVDQTTRLANDATALGALTGTVAYSSPEQLRALPTDERSDIFSFGVLLHEMVTGAHPFARPSMAAMVNAILTEPPPPLAVPVFEQIVRRCLEKDRGRRFGSFHEIRAALRTGVASSAPRRRGTRRWAIATLSVAVAAAATGTALRFGPAWLRVSEPALAFNARDWILITDCDNLTGDSVFDRSLAVALDVGLSQSSYVNVYSRDRVRTTLRRMRKTGGTPIDLALASEIAQRDNVRAVLTCSISRVGDAYSLAARLVDPRTQRVALTESVSAGSRDRVLPALDQLGGRLRRRLGESLATLTQDNRPLPQATTSSLDALKMYGESLRLTNRDDAAGEQLLRQAIDLDPEFAMAHAALGYRYFLKAEAEARRQGDQHLTRALSLTSRLTTRERMWIQAAANDARGNRDVAAVEYRSYLAQYPDDHRAWFRLGWTYMAGLGQYQVAANAFTRVTDIDSKDSSAWVNLGSCYAGLRQYQRAVEMYQKAFSLNPDDVLGMFVNGEYGAALIHLGRVSDAEAVFARLVAHPDPVAKARGLRSMAFAQMYRGHYRQAVGTLRQAIALNTEAGATVSAYRDRMIAVAVLQDLGATAEVRRELAAATTMIAQQPFGPEWLFSLVRVHARLGNIREAQRITALMTARSGNAVTASTTNRNVARDEGYVQLARAELELAQQRPAEAAALAAGAAVRLNTVVLETRAHAEALAGRRQEAAAHYAELIDQVTLVAETQLDYFNAHAALARLYDEAGRREDARTLSERVATLWKDGDPELAVLRDARARLAAVSVASRPRR